MTMVMVSSMVDVDKKEERVTEIDAPVRTQS